MASNDLQNLIDVLLARDASSDRQVPAGSLSGENLVVQEMRRMTAQLATLSSSGPRFTNTAASSISEKSGNHSLVDAVASAGKDWLGAMAKFSGAGSLISGIAGLFGGSHAEEPPPIQKFALPTPLSVEAALKADRTFASTDFSAGDRTRVIGQPATLPQITVNVRAIDSRSFLDHSEDIAKAVREAMLNSHSLNDVVADL